ncbi:MAG TPA: 2,3-bisphosphoglycerate-independent phosphoglycerate mutase [Gaiellaceae bacterium]|jgi:2,3-bisphosphoglycerate-independent phosphoglycerate mutase|nr:2,3-bisphosphoglycerate-independent phosphoglycerate mutase [Gaiellaceae bacterium]
MRDGRTYPLVVLVILDGWGCAPPGPGNAVSLARTPVFDGLWAKYPHTTLKASGEAVGLPPGQMGNSEVGHLTIGSGRILVQDLMRVNKAIETGELFENEVLRSAFERAENVHLLGLVSHGGVHSHIDHVKALLEFAPEKTWIHAFTDGRDVSPHSAVRDLAELPLDRIATVAGRYYAMDRDKRWDRTDRALRAIVDGEGIEADDPIQAVQDSYDRDVTDEFIEPVVIRGRPRLRPGRDAAVFFNFRPDRTRQLSEKLGELGVDLTTMTRYRDDFDFPVVFAEQPVEMVLADVLAEHGVRQLHAAETEKYAHVTYFFDGGREEEFSGETRLLVPSPRDVPSYDKKPEMSASELADRFVAEIGDGYGFAVINFANADMVGHTGVIPAVVEAVETVDACLGRVVEAVEGLGGVCLVTADHGNAEKLLEDDGVSPHTAHTTSLVPLILTAAGPSLQEGELSDLAPTILALLGYEPPKQMTGRNVVAKEQ